MAAPLPGLTQALDLMFKSFAHLEPNMRRAASLILFWILGAAVLGVLLPSSPAKMGWIVIFIWAVNLPAAWFLSQAAKQMGRNPWFSGVISIIPALAAANFMILYSSLHEASHRKEV